MNNLFKRVYKKGRRVLNYGCGVYSQYSRLMAVDVSKPALTITQQRLALHGKEATFLHIDEVGNQIPLPSESVDYIYPSGPPLRHSEDSPPATAPHSQAGWHLFRDGLQLLKPVAPTRVIRFAKGVLTKAL